MKELPLQSLFASLRKAGMPLGLNEYQLLLKALQGGFGIRDRLALRELCYMILTKSLEERDLLDYHFDRIMAQEVDPEPKKHAKVKRRMRIPIVVFSFLFGIGVSAIAFYIRSKLSTSPFVVQPPQNFPIDRKVLNWLWWMVSGAITVGSATAFTWILRSLLRRSLGSSRLLPTQDPLGTQNIDGIADQFVQLSVGKKLNNYFLLSGDYLPVTRRQMKRNWRYLSLPVREGVPIELDIDTTVRNIGSCGMFLEPVLIPPRVNRASLLILVDCGGSMVPFEPLSRRIVNTAKKGKGLGSLGVYYFQNCPASMWSYANDYLLYSDMDDPGSAQRLSEVLERFTSPQLSVLILSDGGAARGGFSDDRRKATQKFLIVLRQKVRNLVWLNPLPKSRWRHTTADKISNQVSMFESDPLGIDAAIAILRGKNRKTY